MFSVLFEVHPMSEQRDNYLGYARMLRPELETVDGFVDNIRYRSLTRVDCVALRLARREVPRPLARKMRHHQTQEKGRTEILLDYRLRVGQLTRDTRLP